MPASPRAICGWCCAAGPISNICPPWLCCCAPRSSNPKEAVMRFAEQWSWCTVERIRDVAPLIREITLKPDGAVVRCPLGSHINVSLLIDGQPQTRSYSLVGDHRDAERYRIAVRLAPDSRGGSRAIWALQPGARIEISSPSSLFEIDWHRPNYCLIAGGIGITP